ncbi:hypothetical protein PoB_001350700 [Plakobranchus ocellatus]|uniref:Uncharacterized protein n=1 Tax=Plakobranchus ocellatus TaxID=259542 RepID=A0AAV3YVK1_9GAST|nr:hypothetical protein PoB_001350700 [Plakobranchus ocellatus]
MRVKQWLLCWRVENKEQTDDERKMHVKRSAPQQYLEDDSPAFQAEHYADRNFLVTSLEQHILLPNTNSLGNAEGGSSLIAILLNLKTSKNPRDVQKRLNHSY